jgi:hypothetical protein
MDPHFILLLSAIAGLIGFGTWALRAPSRTRKAAIVLWLVIGGLATASYVFKRPKSSDPTLAKCAHWSADIDSLSECVSDWFDRQPVPTRE